MTLKGDRLGLQGLTADLIHCNLLLNLRQELSDSISNRVLSVAFLSWHVLLIVNEQQASPPGATASQIPTRNLFIAAVFASDSLEASSILTDRWVLVPLIELPIKPC